MQHAGSRWWQRERNRTPVSIASTQEEPGAHHFRRYLLDLAYARLPQQKREGSAVSPNGVFRKTADMTGIIIELRAKDTDVHNTGRVFARSELFTKRIR